MRLQQDLKNDLIAGLLVVIPLATTIWLATLVTRFVVSFLTSVPKQFNPFNTLNPLLQELINLSVGLLVPLLGILLIGLMARNNRWPLVIGFWRGHPGPNSFSWLGLQDPQANSGNRAAR